jgi:ABC-type transporter Mla subunit MlaD
MNLRRRQGSPLSSPVLIGALTVLVTIVAVVLAFQANNGLPFVPRYTLHVDVRDAEELTRGGEVHEGGTLIGSVTSVDARRTRSGQPIAVLNIALDKSVQPLPVDTRFTIRLKAAIGEKYLDVALGHAHRTFHNGATVPVSQTGAEVDLDQVLSMFTPPTRAGIASSTVGLSDGLAGRGTGLNSAIGAFVPLVSNLTPVMRNLASRQSDLGGFIDGLEALSSALAPVADQQAALYGSLDTTFRALAGVADPYLQQSISDGPPAEQAVIDDSASEQAFATDTAALFDELRPAVATLSQSAPVLNQAFLVGARSLPGTAATDAKTVGLAHTLGAFSTNPSVQSGFDRLTLTAKSLKGPLDFLTPVQSSCNYVTLFLRNIASAVSDPVGAGTVLRFVLISISDVAGGEAEPSSTPYLTNNPAAGTDQAPLHADPYPNTNSPGEIAECSAGNEPFNAVGAAIGNPTGDVGLKTETTTTATAATTKTKGGSK